MRSGLRAAWAGVLSMLALPSANAEPWAAPGDSGLRGDVQLLADAGILDGPVTTWPLAWPEIAHDALAAHEDGLDESTANALLRLKRLARDASVSGWAGVGIRMRAAYAPATLRDFTDQPREEAELTVRSSWLGEHLAINIQGTYAVDPDDGKEFRADGSYVGVSFGNYMLSAGLMERWWGPGWDSSLILSTNARPIPGVALERGYATPFQTRWLSWLGPWRAIVFTGRAESHDVAVTSTRFFAARVNFKPRSWLEFGLTRTAQWCGGERSCDWSTFADMVVGKDNQVGNDSSTDVQPGNQMAGYDMRLRSPWRGLPLAFYTQWIGEDEAGGLPAKFIAQFGLETWGSLLSGSWRVRAEYTDTACNFARRAPEFDCAYRSTIYPQGYTYRGRVIGDAMDNDSRRFTLAGSLSLANGDFFEAAVRRLQLNRDGGDHAISDAPLDVDNVEFRYSRGLFAGKISVGVGYDEPVTQPDSSSGLHGFLTWQQGF